MKKNWIQLTHDEKSEERISRIYLCNKEYCRDISADELDAIMDFREQLSMLDDGHMEVSFSDISQHAKELESCFKAIKKYIKYPGVK